jgi:type III secretion system (T3SS) SseB-like protein
MTPLDAAHAHMTAAPENAVCRLRYYEQLAQSVLFLLLADEPAGGAVSPVIHSENGQDYVLVFDLEERLVAFTGVTSAHAALEGREVMSMLEGRDIGLAVNLNSGNSGYLLPPDVLDWLRDALSNRGVAENAAAQEILPPLEPDPELIAALHQRFARLAGKAEAAFLTGVRYRDGRRGNLLAFVGASQTDEPELQRIVAEVVSFRSQTEALDVTFLTLDDPALVAIRKAGLQIQVPVPTPRQTLAPVAPGMDPDKPPKLK